MMMSNNALHKSPLAGPFRGEQTYEQSSWFSISSSGVTAKCVYGPSFLHKHVHAPHSWSARGMDMESTYAQSSGDSLKTENL